MKHFRLCVLCLICMLVSFMAGAQTRTISISAKDEPVRKVLRQIELQSGYTFFYSDRTVDVDRRVTIEATDKDVLAVVNEIFDGYGVKCSIIDRNIVLTDDDSDGNLPERVRRRAHRSTRGVLSTRRASPLSVPP